MSNPLSHLLVHIANEPSVGLYRIQQHIHEKVPNILHTTVFQKVKFSHLY